MNFLHAFVGGAVALAIAGSASAATTTYTDRTTFNAAASPSLFEDFNGFASDAYFTSSAVVAGFMTLSTSPGINTSFGNNRIDVPPYGTILADVDGSAALNVFTHDGASVFLTFSQALRGWGADFRGFNDSEIRTQVFLDGLEVSTAMTVGDTTRFIGFVSDTAFTTLEFRGIVNDVFGVDNVAGAVAAVPEPATWALMIGGFGLAGASLRRRKAMVA